MILTDKVDSTYRYANTLVLTLLHPHWGMRAVTMVKCSGRYAQQYPLKVLSIMYSERANGTGGQGNKAG